MIHEGRPTYDEQRLLNILTKLTSSLGTVGALWLIIDVLTCKDKRKRSKERLLFAVSVTDLIQSVCLFVGTWAMPAESQIYGAFGNITTCNIQGFLLTFSNVCTSLYSACFGICFLLLAKSQRDASLEVEKFIHVFNISFSLIGSIAGLLQKKYNPTLVSCLLGKWPPGCSGDECVRGGGSIYMIVLFVGLPIIISYLLYCPALMMIYCDISKKLTVRISHDEVRLSVLKTIQIQALLYLGAFYVTLTFPIINRALYHASVQIPTVTAILAATFHPMKGFFNALIYKQGEVIRFWKQFKLQSKSNEVARAPVIVESSFVDNSNMMEESST